MSEVLEVLEAKDKAEALRALCEGAFRRRTEIHAIEWKTNFTLWTGIVLAGWVLHSKPETQHIRWWSLFFLLVLPTQTCLVHIFARSEQKAVDFAFAYLAELEKLIGLENRPSSNPRQKLYQWYFVDLGPTLLLVIAAIMLLW